MGLACTSSLTFKFPVTLLRITTDLFRHPLGQVRLSVVKDWMGDRSVARYFLPLQATPH